MTNKANPGATATAPAATMTDAQILIEMAEQIENPPVLRLLADAYEKRLGSAAPGSVVCLAVLEGALLLSLRIRKVETDQIEQCKRILERIMTSLSADDDLPICQDTDATFAAYLAGHLRKLAAESVPA